MLGYFGGVNVREKTHHLSFVGKPPLAQLSGTELFLFFSQNYRIVQCSHDDQAWKVSTTSYFYRLDDEEGNEILSYHWHPHSAPAYPHLHLKRGSLVGRAELQKTHMPTGRVAVESVVEFLVETFNVVPLEEDWEHIVLRNLRQFEANRSWG